MLDLSNEKQAHIDARLRSDPIIWLSSVRPDGRPHSVAVWFLWDGNDILIFSMPNNQKIRNLRHDNRVFLALDDTHEGEDVITLEGTAELLTDPTIDVTSDAYVAKYAERMKGLGWTPDDMAQRYSQGIRITPTRIG